MSVTHVRVKGSQYETVAEGGAQVLGTIGKIGDVIERIVIIPGATTIGVVTLADGATVIPIHIGGTTTINPFVVELGMKSISGAWSIVTGGDVSVIAVGQFS